MRITIVQAEIEEAIINHIKSQVTVKEDMEITIDLRATRGAEGYQADIDIHAKPAETTSTKPKAPAAPKESAAPKSDVKDETQGDKAAGDKDGTKDDASKGSEPLGIVAAAKPARTPRTPAKPLAVTQNADDTISAPVVEDTGGEINLEDSKDSAPSSAIAAVNSIFANREAPADKGTDETQDAPAVTAAPVRSIFAGLSTPVN